MFAMVWYVTSPGNEIFTFGEKPPDTRKCKSRLALKKHTLLPTKKEYYSRIGDAFASKGFVRMAREKKWG